MAAVMAKLPTGRLPPAINEGAAFPEVDSGGLVSVVEPSSRAVREGSSRKLALTELPLVHDSGDVLVPDTKLTAAHCNS